MAEKPNFAMAVVDGKRFLVERGILARCLSLVQEISGMEDLRPGEPSGERGLGAVEGWGHGKPGDVLATYVAISLSVEPFQDALARVEERVSKKLGV